MMTLLTLWYGDYNCYGIEILSINYKDTVKSLFSVVYSKFAYGLRFEFLYFSIRIPFLLFYTIEPNTQGICCATCKYIDSDNYPCNKCDEGLSNWEQI